MLSIEKSSGVPATAQESSLLSIANYAARKEQELTKRTLQSQKDHLWTALMRSHSIINIFEHKSEVTAIKYLRHPFKKKEYKMTAEQGIKGRIYAKCDESVLVKVLSSGILTQLQWLQDILATQPEDMSVHGPKVPSTALAL